MIKITNELSVPKDEILFTFALESEAGEIFNTYNTLFTGIGKVNAAYELTKSIIQRRPSIIVNLGSAGSNYFQKGDVICCTKFIQRDMDVQGLGFDLYETPLSKIPPILQYGIVKEDLPIGICGTGDSFEMSHATTTYNVVDMEAYALALIAMKEKIPFLSLKYISDGADDNAADDWSVLVHKAAVAFGKVFDLK